MQTTKKQLESKTRIFALAVFGALVLANSQPVFAQKTYQVLSPADKFGTNVFAVLAIAANGTCLGYAEGSTALITRNSIQPLDAPSGPFDPYSASYTCVNASLTTAGSIYLEDDSDTVAFVRQADGTFTLLSFPFGSAPQPTAINDNGTVVGSYYDQDGNGQGFVADGKGIHTIDIPGGSYIQPTGINASGVVVGTYYDENFESHNFIMDNKGISEWTLPGATFAYAYCIADNGAIGGVYSDGTKLHGFVSEGGKVSTIDYRRTDLPDSITRHIGGKDIVFYRYSSYPTVNGINDRGDIVGYTWDIYKADDPSIHFISAYQGSFWGTPLP